ncbi:hypothetical protein L6452_31849 [Arctium lappa]|uniref:Uncharacterized protein n=1 Tax=Arctium lappa TaxID=4217 RepID=A0ACB8Z3J4_ARCLA|nr:hypothetical protein L6452_31849 [Arctium lappa]
MRYNCLVQWVAVIESLPYDSKSDKSFGMKQRPDGDIEIDEKFWEEDFHIPTCSKCDGDEDLDGFYKNFVQSRINGVKLGDKCTIMMYGQLVHERVIPCLGVLSSGGLFVQERVIPCSGRFDLFDGNWLEQGKEGRDMRNFFKDVIKIADFGLAREITSQPPYTEYVSCPGGSSTVPRRFFYRASETIETLSVVLIPDVALRLYLECVEAANECKSASNNTIPHYRGSSADAHLWG